MHALLTSGPEGATEYVDADLRDPETILAQAAKMLDLARPVTVLLVATPHCVPDADHP
jgi:S-adenosyl methyltransferase